MSRFFSMDSGLVRFLTRLADLVILNLLFLICSLPIFTIGASWTALYYVTLKMVRDEESYIVRSFFRSFRQNFRQATLLWLGVLLFAGVMAVDFRILAPMSGMPITVLRVALMAMCFFAILVLLYLFPVLSKFYNTVPNTLRNAILMSIRHFPMTIVMLIVPAAAAVGTFFNSYTFAHSIPLWILAGFSLIALMNSWFLVRIFDKYIDSENV
ncbi:MAG: DUF624 domain-containing protein [Eubacteriales bacterium]|nr:DUF624 domain-containing protein [Eubacteriales bacterium]